MSADVTQPEYRMHLNKTVLPDGCWFTHWPSSFLHGFWVQHGYNREARKLFHILSDADGIPSGDIVRWILSCHEHRPCEPYKAGWYVKNADSLP